MSMDLAGELNTHFTFASNRVYGIQLFPASISELTAPSITDIQRQAWPSRTDDDLTNGQMMLFRTGTVTGGQLVEDNTTNVFLNDGLDTWSN